MKTCLLILGMHRSGTSALAGALNCAGVSFGRTLAAPTVDNPKGYFESKAVMQFNDERLLPLLGRKWWTQEPMPQSGWDMREALTPLVEEAKTILADEFSGERLFGLKDPRICLLVPFWLRVLRELDIDVGIILPYRNPREVASSLHRRNGMSIEQGVILWLDHLISAELGSRGLPRLFMTYAQLLSDPWAVLERVRKTFAIEWRLPEQAILERLANFIDGSLRHHVVTSHSDHQGSYPGAVEAFATCYETGLAALGDEDAFCIQLDFLGDKYLQEKAFYSALSKSPPIKLEIYGSVGDEVIPEPLSVAWLNADGAPQALALPISGELNWDRLKLHIRKASMILQVEELSLWDEDEIELTSAAGKWSTNAACREKDVYFFETSSPLLKLADIGREWGGRSPLLHFRFRFLELGDDAKVISAAVKKFRVQYKQALNNAATQRESMQKQLQALRSELRTECARHEKAQLVLNDQLRAEHSEMASLLAERERSREVWQDRLARKDEELARMRMNFEGVQAELAALHMSRSWKITRPLRTLSTMTKRVFS